jgi:DNA repair exonuclease SbcCD ATPase subunit
LLIRGEVLEKVIYTQDDLLQALQKLIQERQRVKALESEVKLLKKGPSESAPFPNSNDAVNEQLESELIERAKEIELLKAAIRELGEKLKVANKAPPELPITPIQVAAPVVAPPVIEEKITLQAVPQTLPQPSFQQATAANSQAIISKESFDKITELKQALYHAQNEVRLAKEKNRELAEDIKRQEQFRLSLTHELKEQSVKQQDVERIKNELNAAKTKAFELESNFELIKSEKNEFHKLVEKYRLQIAELTENAHAQVAVTDFTGGEPAALQKELALEKALKSQIELELEDQKLLLREELSQKKVLEIKNGTLTYENEALEVSVQALSTRIAFQEAQFHKLQQDNDGIVRSYTNLQESFEHQRKDLIKTEAELKEKTFHLHEAQIKIEELLKILREDAEKRGEIQKQTKHLEDELSAKEKGFQDKEKETERLYAQLLEQKEHTDLLEQHLARRVKECTLYEQDVDARTKEVRELQKSFSENLQKMQDLSAELYEKEKQETELKLKLEAEIAKLQDENEALYELVEELKLELSELKNVEEKCMMLEELMGNFRQILTPTKTAASKQATTQTIVHNPQPIQKNSQSNAMNQEDLFSSKQKTINPRYDLFQ